MYLHIGMSAYLRTQRVIAIFPRAMLDASPATQPFLQHVTIIAPEVTREEAKACILTDTNELYLSGVNYRTLKQRWETLINS
jgi:hypothetical protein